MKYSGEDAAEPRVIKALSHPLRIQILGLLDGQVRSPKEIAVELSEPLGNVSYHVRTLAELGMIELVRKVPRRGAIEHFYSAAEQHLPGRLVVSVDRPGRAKLEAELRRFIERAREIERESRGRRTDINIVCMLF